jgi:hypothetical protein
MKRSQAIIDEAEALLEKWKHPDPYRPPTAPGGMDIMILKEVHLLSVYRLKVRKELAGANP